MEDIFPVNAEFEGEEFSRTPFEEEEPEAVLEFISSIIDALIAKVIPEKKKPLTLEKAGKCLQVLGKIWNLSEYPPASYIPGVACDDSGKKLMDMEGYIDDYQYLHIEAVDMELTDIRILPQHFIWLLSADLSGNRLDNEKACPVTKLPNLVALRLNRNFIQDPYMPPMKHLQYLGLNRNKIESLHRIYHPNLETLDLNFNKIWTVNSSDCWKHSKLTQLELRGNHLKTTEGIEFASLVNLYLAQNQITELKGLEILVNLQRLHLRDNPLSDLTGFSESNKNLKYLNIRQCQVESVDAIESLSVLKGLQELVVKGNVFNPERKKKSAEQDEERLGEEEEDEDDEDEEDEGKETEAASEDEEPGEEGEEEIRIRILLFLPTLTRIDKKPVTNEERTRMRDVLEQPGE